MEESEGVLVEVLVGVLVEESGEVLVKVLVEESAGVSQGEIRYLNSK